MKEIRKDIEKKYPLLIPNARKVNIKKVFKGVFHDKN